jgi:Methyltransferase domain
MDRVLNTATVNARRAKVCQRLQGRVLEIGFGTGLNLHHYPAEVTEILVVEPSESAMRLARQREAAMGAPIERIGRDGTQLALPDGSVGSRADGIRTPLAAPAASGSQPDRWWLPSRPADRRPDHSRRPDDQ